MLKSFFTILFLGTVMSATTMAGDAGCGLGGMLIKSNTKLLQLFAVTTNGTFFSQTLGITFGTSDCSAKGLVLNDKQIQYFVEVNHSDLIREMAQGYGSKRRLRFRIESRNLRIRHTAIQCSKSRKLSP